MLCGQQTKSGAEHQAWSFVNIIIIIIIMIRYAIKQWLYFFHLCLQEYQQNADHILTLPDR